MSIHTPTRSDADRVLRAACDLPARDELLVRLVLLEGLTLPEALRLRLESEDDRRERELPSDLQALLGRVAAGRTEGPVFLTATRTPLAPEEAREILLAAVRRAGLDVASLARVHKHLRDAA